ncbi:SRPBCC domain-containing protein [Paraflavitalea sp. CAU 1676]|uniref:SRPBCC family protein n=1 Tax=Paraflavitalea sp. CAU 1676 TaxID=3032598 RepID=UPI0023DB3740|nr:SRPBCC domain-containing protein [Paraflavitalea sp. CAU 1676]MDF2188159.1 SRPBCC domain-containing protein [Paraflavitalea sp. CAU 1676]
MSNVNNAMAQGPTLQVELTRQFDAPVARVFKAWHDSVDVKRWWQPDGFTTPVANMNFKEGGKSLLCMRSPDGQDMYNTWTYSKIVPNERIEFVLNFSDKDGKAFDPAQVGLAGIPKDVRHVITFKSLGANKSEITVTEYGYTSPEVVEMSKAGLIQCINKMAAIVQ